MRLRTPDDHVGGIIRNNMIFRAAGQAGDLGIGVWDSPGTHVVNNTIVQSGTYPNAIEVRFANATGVVVRNNLVDGAIVMRTGAQAQVSDNVGGAVPALFVAPSTGDLHLRPTSFQAIDRAVATADATVDFDGDPRPQGVAPDVGADEWRGVSSAPAITGDVLGASRPLPGAWIWVTGAARAWARTASDGSYQVAPLPQGGSFTVTPSAPGWAFSPASRHLSSLSGPTTIDFSGTRVPITTAGAEDVHVRGGSYATANYGGSTTLFVQQSTLAGLNREAWLKFDVGSAGPVNGARLRVYAWVSNTLTPSVKLRVSGTGATNWSEYGLTWSSRPSTRTPLATFTVTGTSVNYYEIDVSDYVRAEQAAGRTLLSFVVDGVADTPASVRIISADASSGQPVLWVW
jgi:hypothetical protein